MAEPASRRCRIQWGEVDPLPYQMIKTRLRTRKERPMKLGYFTMPLHPPTRNYTETLKEDREAIVLADKLGYAEAFVGEHVTDRAETITSCLAFVASLI